MCFTIFQFALHDVHEQLLTMINCDKMLFKNFRKAAALFQENSKGLFISEQFSVFKEFWNCMNDY